MTQCTRRTLEFQRLGRREITARFDAPAITSDAGGLLLREVDAKFKFIERFASCFDDHRSPRFILHSLQELLSQRIMPQLLMVVEIFVAQSDPEDPL